MANNMYKNRHQYNTRDYNNESKGKLWLKPLTAHANADLCLIITRVS